MTAIINLKTRRLFLKIFKGLFKISIAAAGATAFTNPVSASIAGIGVIASAVSSAVKDKRFKPLMKLVNIAACNFDKASNDSTTNR